MFFSGFFDGNYGSNGNYENDGSLGRLRNLRNLGTSFNKLFV